MPWGAAGEIPSDELLMLQLDLSPRLISLSCDAQLPDPRKPALLYCYCAVLYHCWGERKRDYTHTHTPAVHSPVLLKTHIQTCSFVLLKTNTRTPCFLSPTHRNHIHSNQLSPITVCFRMLFRTNSSMLGDSHSDRDTFWYRIMSHSSQTEPQTQVKYPTDFWI